MSPAHTSWEETSSAGRASAQPFPCSRGDTSVQQCLPHPTGHLNTLQLPQGQAGTAGTKPCSIHSPPFWGGAAVAEATINSTFCLLFMIIKLCVVLVMFPSKKLSLHTCCVLYVIYYVFHDSCFFTPFLFQLYQS